MINNFSKLVIATAFSLTSSFFFSIKAQASNISFNFEVNITSGPLLGETFTGFFDTDVSDSVFTTLGFQEIEPDLAEFSFLGITYTEADVDNVNIFSPQINLLDGNLIGLEWILNSTEADNNFLVSILPGISDISEVSFNYEIIDVGGFTAGEGEGDITFSEIIPITTTPISPSTTTPESDSIFALLGFGVLGVKLLQFSRRDKRFS